MIRSKAFNVIDSTNQKKLADPVQNWIRSSKKQKGIYFMDSDNKKYCLISLGEKTNSGYRLELEKVEEMDQKMIVFIKEIFPDPKMFYNPVITYPYLLAEVEKPIEIEVRIVNSHGNTSLFSA